MDAMCIPNISHRKDFTTTLGTVKGEAVPLVGRTMLADNRKRVGRLQTEGYLAARMCIIVYTAAACLPDLAIRTCPGSPTQVQGSTPCKLGVVVCTCPSTAPGNFG
ncbi:hypothetical protein BDA96_01G262900 [Sorghum bicolor]|uniref:Uncharacterized protein n=2 Tax=Sorghum bicolor TaxID=4558 RepID=A0A921UYW7_SORBI|nr:hypothetical protein BDA96_01G262900 [Sorghum bicolor]KAG0549521.1 hypothetical protein BDA96_01G262900 [Sorghum bicolor]KAG0549522.1 hypothetical protein BDA96_01G262900 [Sorghum bicolor]KXG38531.1 hypothetical protein SORBI_3001G248400 [Sorghum bicolor]KXG38532.1 hypothetical protein SORBI_3001G248400 [Sorghum bicolor]